MTAMELIAQLRAKGIRLRVHDGALEVDAPKGSLDEPLRREIMAHKPELLRLLSWSRRSGSATAVALQPADRSQALPLSWAQQRLWFLDQLEPGNAAYNISWTVRLNGALDTEQLRAALADVINRHEVLRTVFPAADGNAVVAIREHAPVELPVEDMHEASDEQLRARLADLAGCKFDLAHGPLLRASLLRLGEREHILLIVVHHIVADGASMRILFRELAACYEARLTGVPAELAQLPVQYADYAVWQRRWLDSAEIDQQSAYWQRQLAGLPPLLELPTDRPRAAAMRYRGASVLRVLPADLAADLRRLSREHGCTLFMTMLAAFFVLLQRYAGREDLVVGTPLGGRSRTQLEGLIGFFVNTVVLRADLGGDPAFAELLQHVREVALEAHANQDLPFEKLVELLQPERELSYAPIFQVMFDLQEEPRWKLPVRSLEVIPEVVFSSRTASFDLTLSVRQAEQGLDAMFEYDTDLFDEASIEALAQRYQTLLEAIVLDAGQPLSQLPLVDPGARRRQVHAWNTAQRDYPATSTIADLFEARAAAQCQAPALIDGRRSYSYAELNAAANRISADLRAGGVTADATVAICARRCAETFAAIVGVHKAGGCVVPLDPAYPDERLAFMLQDSGAAWLLHHPDDHELAATLCNGMQQINCLQVRLEPDIDVSAAPPNPVPAAAVKNLAYLMYTSGTSGMPKGAELEHGGLVNYITQLADFTATGSADRILQFASLSFDIAIEESLTALLNGAALVLRSAEMTHSLQDFVAGCERDAISWLSLPTAWWHELCEALERQEVSLPESLRTVVIGGEKADLQALRKWQRHAGQVRLFNTYGPTETSVVAAWAEIGNLDTRIVTDIPLGLPVPNVRVWIMDARLQPVPEGLPGEICIAGPGVARGYRQRPALSAEKFVSVILPDGSRQRIYRTGDRARYVQGQGLVFLGRSDAQLKVRGHRVEPGEIEAVLAAQPGVGRCAVVPVGDAAMARLVAYATGTADPDELRRRLAAQLPEYMVPSAIMMLEQLPFTANGKLDRAALPVPPVSRTATAAYREPAGNTEQTLARIWCDVLGVERPGADDNFFALGGHSLLATRIMARVRDACDTSVPLRALFDNPTIAGLARMVDAAGNDDALPLRPRPASMTVPPVSWPQQRLLMLDKLEPGNTAYNLYSVARLTGPLDIDTLQCAVDATVARHESLRTVFAEHDGEPVQIIQPLTRVPVELADAGDGALEARLGALINVPFDLSRGPLLRVHLLRDAVAADGRDRHILLLLMHHIVADGWSVQRLLRELQQHYRAGRAGTVAALPELPLQYADFACWQREELAAGALHAAEQYWAKQLRDLPPWFGLTPDYQRPAVQSYRGHWVSRPVDVALLNRLEQFAADQSATLFMVMLTAFKATLLRHTGNRDVVVGTPVAGRTHTDLEPLIGCFLNTLVLRTRCAANPDFTAMLAAVRQTALDAFQHQLLPFEKLLELLQPPRTAAYTPLVQVMFNLHNEREELPGLPDVAVEPILLQRAAAKFDLSVAITATDNGLVIGFEYNRDLYTAGRMATVLDDYLLLLEAMVADPAAKPADIRLCEASAKAERRAAVAHLPAFDGGNYASVPQRFAAVASRYADRVALRDRQRSLTYGELSAQVAAIAATINAARHEPAAASQSPAADAAAPMTAVLLGHDVGMPAVLLGVLQSGCAYVPLDPAAPPAHSCRIMATAGADLIVTDTAHAPAARDIAADAGARVVVVSAECTAGDSVSPMVGMQADSEADCEADTLAYVLFTSGSTGEPKGVMQTHANLLQHIATYSQSLAITATDTLSLIPGYGFDAAVMDIYGALLSGACLQIIDLQELPAADELEQLLRTVSVLHMTPTVLRYLLHERDSQAAPLPARALVLGGEAASYRDFELFNRHFAPGSCFVNGLGPSESTLALQFVAQHGDALPGRQVPVGRPVPGCAALLLDEQGEPAGVCGELVLRSRYISPGYLNMPALTAQKMHPDALSGDTLYYTGDRVWRRPDGQLVYAGRLDGQVKIRGQRVEPGAIETALGAQPGVERCAVLADGERLTAYFCGEAEGSELRLALQAVLPAPLIPARFVRLARLPLLPNGKVDRRRVAEHGASAADTNVDAGEHAVPVSATEIKLATMWAELLGHGAPGRHDDFFAHGGHSLLAMRLLARVRDSFAVTISLRTFFAAPTVAGLAAALAAAGSASRNAESSAPVLRPRDSSAGLPPLSWAQQRLWFLDRLEPDNAAYNLHWAARFDGMPDTQHLQQALLDLQQRHESLRTAFADHAGEPVQVIHSAAEISLRHEHLRGADDAELQRRMLERVRIPFDLRSAPLLRVYLLELGPDDAVLLLVMHHIIADGWSMGVLFDELSALYAARTCGRPAALPELPVQYADFALWQQRWLSGATLQRQQAYWAQQLAELPPLLELPLDYPRPPVQRFRGAWVNRQFDATLLQQLQQLASAEGATLFMVLLAAFKVLLMRHTGRTDMVVGAPVAGRNRAETENLIGFFLNTLVLRTAIDPDASFRAVLAAVRQTTLEAYDHQDLPFEKLLELLQPARSTAHSPLVQVTINLHNEPAGRLTLDELTARVLQLDRGTSKFDLALALVEGQDGLQAGIEYNTDLFDTATVAGLLQHLGELLEGFCAEPDLPVSQARLSATAPPVKFTQPFAAMPASITQQTLVQRFTAVARRYPQHAAVRMAGATLTYAQLDGLANALATKLVAAGQARTAILLGHEVSAVVAMLGVLKAGQAYVPLDRHAPPARLRQVIAAAGAGAVVTDAQHAALLPAEVTAELPVLLLSDSDQPAAAAPDVDIEPDSLAYVLFTSGSTGEPKGVMQSHAGVLHHTRVYSNALHLQPQDRLTLLSAYGFDAAVMDIFGALLNGACLYPLDLRSESYPGQLLDRMSDAGITVLHATPTVFRYLMRSKVCRHELDAVRAVVLGGEEAHGSDFDLFRRQFAPPAVFINGLGPSESTTAVQFFADHQTRLPGGLVPVGEAVADTELQVLDAAGTPTGLTGELAVISRYLAQGYWQLPDLTAARFRDLPDGRRMYLTGDLVRRLPDGQLVFLGRLDDQVKLRGIRVEPAEIEAALLAVPGVDSAAVLLLDNGPGGAARLAAWYTGTAERKPLRDALRASLPDFMIPGALVRIDSLPLTANGKLDRHQLPEPDWERDAASEFVAPRTPTEERLSAIWSDVLGVQKISVHDDFFELGGHSLLAAQLAARVNESMQVVLPLRRLFDSPTVAQIAEHIETLQWAMRAAE